MIYNTHMSILSAYIEKPEKTFYAGEDRDEEILYVLRKSRITTFTWLGITAILLITPIILDPAMRSVTLQVEPVFSLTFLFIATIFWYLISFGYFFQNLLNWFFNVYIVTTKKIVDVDFHGIIFKNISEATLENVEDVTSTVRGTFGVIFDIGDVYIQTAAERREFEFTQVDNPAKIRDIISDIVAEKRGHSANN